MSALNKRQRRQRSPLAPYRHLTRRDALQLGAASMAALSSFELMSSKARAFDVTTNPAEKLLFVFSATGGGSMIDSGMTVTESEVGGGAAEKLCFPDSTVSAHGGVMGGGMGDPTALRALDLPDHMRLGLIGAPGTAYNQADFMNAHLPYIAAMTSTGTSVNHFVAQTRALTGAGINAGKTLGEAVAEIYGGSLSLPFLNMGAGGFLVHGADPSLPTFARGEPVVVPSLFAISTDAARGVVGAPGGLPTAAPQIGAELDRARELIARSRTLREQAEQASIFGQTYQCSSLHQRVSARRAFAQSSIEPADLITNLLFITGLPLADFGLEVSPGAAETVPLVEAMPGGMADRSVNTDPLLAQVVLAYLATRYGYTTSVNLGPLFNTDVANLDVHPPLAFDNSHASHVVAQQQMWSRVLDGVDKLIRLLQMTNTDDGGTMWDRSLIYIASDFGRDKFKGTPQLFSDYVVPADGGPEDYSPQNTGHNLNNGSFLISPMLNGGRRYGGIDNAELLTHGFDPITGLAAPGTAMNEGDLYSVVCQALGVPFTGRRDFPIMVVGA